MAAIAAEMAVDMRENKKATVCPVCASPEIQPFFSLPNFPVYLHEVGADVAQVPRDLNYASCTACGHAFIPGYDRELLEDIYRHHYWGADVENIGHSQRDEFARLFSRVRAALPLEHAEVLEIGCSSGQMLRELQTRFAQDAYSGFEPNVANTEVCREQGYAVTNSFFGEESAQACLSRRAGRGFDLIYHRHVIEHIFDFDDFFRGMNVAAAPGARLLIETPSLEANLASQSLNPFCHEHIHVFAAASLATLAARFGWQYQESACTAMDNTIAVFLFAPGETGPAATRPQNLPRPDSAAFARNIGAWQQRLRNATRGQRVMFWGAGSYCTTLLSLCDIAPEKILDGNPNKAGKRMAGSVMLIEHAPQAIQRLLESGEDMAVTMVIASSYHAEIQAELKRLGWRGPVIVPSLMLAKA